AQARKGVEATMATNLQTLNQTCHTAISATSVWEGVAPEREGDAGAFANRCEDSFLSFLTQRCGKAQGQRAVQERVKRIVCRYHPAPGSDITLSTDGLLLIVVPLDGNREERGSQARKFLEAALQPGARLTPPGVGQ